MKKIRFLFLNIYFISSFLITANSQILNDPIAQKQSLQALDNIYNFKFQDAKNIIEQIRKKYPKHPAIPFMKAMVLYWQYVPLTQSSSKFPEFDKYMSETILKAESILSKNKQDIEGIYFKMLGYSLKSLLESEEGSFMKSVGYGKKAFQYMKKGFDKTAIYPDFHFSTGLYRYYAEQYPQTHPIAKPFMAFFPYGNKQQGLNHLAQATNKAQFSRTESTFYLCQIYAKYEKNYQLASYYAQKLIAKYPRNPLFWVKYAEFLMWQGKYSSAEKLFYKFAKQTKKNFVIASAALQGWLQEKKYKNIVKAELAYKKAIQYSKYDYRYSVDYVSMAYAGLARIADSRGKTNLAKEYYKKSLNIAEYESIKEEAKQYSRNH